MQLELCKVREALKLSHGRYTECMQNFQNYSFKLSKRCTDRVGVLAHALSGTGPIVVDGLITVENDVAKESSEVRYERNGNDIQIYGWDLKENVQLGGDSAPIFIKPTNTIGSRGCFRTFLPVLTAVNSLAAQRVAGVPRLPDSSRACTRSWGPR
eukprot:scaffold91563_cov60-Phaeocystis_antarctica.AAC.2